MMVVHRRRYLKIRAEIRRIENERKAKEISARQAEIPDITYRSVINDTSTYRKRQVTKQEAVFMIEKAWIRFR